MHFTQASLAVAVLVSSTLAANHIVEVGKNAAGDISDAFNPTVLTAAKGDTVTFQFYPDHHNVVQSPQNSPCQTMSGGFYSPVLETASGMNKMEYVLTINNTDPIFYYCSEEDHCNIGMVGVINAPKSDYMAYAKAAQSAQKEEPASEDEAVGGVLQKASTMSGSGGSGGGNSSDGGNAGTTYSVAGGAIAFAAIAFGSLYL